MNEHLDFQAVSRPRSTSLAVVLALVLFLMAAPAVVAAIAVGDSNLLQGVQGWAHDVSAWISYPAPVIFVVPLVAVAMVARERDDA
jgi:hypothetical protein